MTKFKVGIIGFGFVGESQAFAFAPVADVKIFDVDRTKSTHTIDEVLSQDFIFVCIPTPMKENGEQDLSYIENFFGGIGLYNTEAIFILKSTVLPGTTKQLEEKFNFNIVFCPEFLTEKTAKLDMLTQSRIVIGGSNPLKVHKIKELFEARFGNKHYVVTDSTSAELIKLKGIISDTAGSSPFYTTTTNPTTTSTQERKRKTRRIKVKKSSHNMLGRTTARGLRR
jgi:UDPglucose 6-dehydrogenase